MANLHGFNANTVEPMGDFEPIAAGKYVAIITNSETKPNQSGTGSYLELTFQIIEGEYRNRLLWARLNLDNPSEMAVKIARAQLASICKAVNIPTPQDSAELHNLPLVIGVKIKRRKDTDEFVNEVKGFYKRQSSIPAAPAASRGVAPWKR